MSASHRLRELVAEPRVVPVYGVPSAAHARLMQVFGVEVAFFGTALTMGNYTGLPDLGVVTMTEGISLARYITRAVDFPVIFDGDTGHGGDAAVRRLVEECIDAGLAGVRIDDQRIESKRSTLSPGILIEERADAIHRYEVAVARRDELDPDFVVMAQCYARNAENGGEDVYLDRLASYGAEGGVDWVNFECPCSDDEVRAARAVVKGGLSIMQGKLAAMPRLDQLAAWGADMAWYTSLPDLWIKACSWDILSALAERGLDAWDEFRDRNPENPFVVHRFLDAVLATVPSGV